MTKTISRRRALVSARSLIAAPAILRAQEARTVRIVQQRGLASWKDIFWPDAWDREGT
jgi:uncharacterized protein YfaQ (DUF2300 family)